MSILTTWINKETASFFAILLSPLIAWYVQYLKSKKDSRTAKKLEIFSDLMLTRGYGQTQSLSHRHVNALNRIDIEFYDNKNVLDAWDIYREHLLHPDLQSIWNMAAEKKEVIQLLWDNERKKHLVNLLYAIACVLGYKKLNKIVLEKKMYVPAAYNDLEEEQNLLRKGFINVLNGKKSIKVEMSNHNNETEATSKND